MTTRNQCQYGFWCIICKLGFISMKWEVKESIKSIHKHPKDNKK